MCSLLWLIAFMAIFDPIKSEDGWSWNDEPSKQIEDSYSPEIPDLFASPSEPISQQQNATEVDQIVDHILTSTRQGRNVDGFDDVYSDPNIQNALQNGDDGEARNLIKERLCSLGLMKVKATNVGKSQGFIISDLFLV